MPQSFKNITIKSICIEYSYLFLMYLLSIWTTIWNLPEYTVQCRNTTGFNVEWHIYYYLLFREIINKLLSISAFSILNIYKLLQTLQSTYILQHTLYPPNQKPKTNKFQNYFSWYLERPELNRFFLEDIVDWSQP